MTTSATQRVIGTLLTAIESRDLRAIDDVLAPAATWQNVPHDPATGREAVVALLAGIINWSDRVQWDVVSAGYDESVGWLERVDRFWIDGREHAVRCCGVFRVDPEANVVVEVRDYVDLGEWRARIGPVYETMSAQPASAVVERHISAVTRRDTVAMAADYALDAQLDRAGQTYEGYREIATYFDTVPSRLEGRELAFGTPHTGESAVTVPWTISHDGAAMASGRDEFVVEAGRIVHQTVNLDTPDF